MRNLKVKAILNGTEVEVAGMVIVWGNAQMFENDVKNGEMIQMRIRTEGPSLFPQRRSSQNHRLTKP